MELAHRYRSIREAFQLRHWQALVSLVCLAVIVAGVYRQVAPQPLQGPDFIHTYDAALAVRHGQNPYVTATAWVSGYTPGSILENQYFYAPTYALLLSPLTFLPYQAALTLWGVIIGGLLFVTVYALARSIGWRPSAMGFLLLVTAASIMTAVRAELFLGQANLFMVACICLAFWARQAGHSRLAGVLLALACVTKPMLLAVAVFLLWKREFKFAAATFVGFAALLLLPFVWIGTHALGDLLGLWQFYSNQYLSFSENIAPRGMLERLFTVNPFVRPLIVAPALASALWLAIAAVVLVVTLSVIAPRPLRRDKRSLLEIGVILCALMLISPLTEPPYLVSLIVPLFASVSYLRGADWQRGRFGIASFVLLGLWMFELVPRSTIENFFWSRIDPAQPLMAAVYVTLAPSRFYLLVAVFLLQLHVLSRASGIGTRQAVAHLVRNCPSLAWEWLTDLGGALKPAPRSLTASSTKS
jgi:Glycosyltransferase family 87